MGEVCLPRRVANKDTLVLKKYEPSELTSKAMSFGALTTGFQLVFIFCF